MVVFTYHLALNVGERYTPSGTAAVIVSHRARHHPGAGVALGLERFSARAPLGLVVAFAGVVVVVLLGSGEEISFDNAKGPLIVLGAPLAFALFNVITKPLLARHSPLGVSAAASLIGTAALLPLTSDDVLSTAGSLDAWDWTLILYLGLVCTLFAYVAWTAALGHLDASRAVAYIYLVPVFAVIVGAAALGEEITPGCCSAGAGDRRRRAGAVRDRAVASPGRSGGPRPVNWPHGQGLRRGTGGRGGRGRARARRPPRRAAAPPQTRRVVFGATPDNPAAALHRLRRRGRRGAAVRVRHGVGHQGRERR